MAGQWVSPLSSSDPDELERKGDISGYSGVEVSIPSGRLLTGWEESGNTVSHL